jgi:hypothetical protein
VGRWLSRDPIGEIGFRAGTFADAEEDEIPNERHWSTYQFVQNDPIRFTDVLGLKTKVKKCNVVVYLGHNYTVPQGTIENEDCSAAAVVSCGKVKGTDPGKPTKPIPGTGRIPGSISIDKGEQIALAWFKAGVNHAKSICESCCNCKEVTVLLECDFGIHRIQQGSLQPGTCGKTVSIKCSQPK